MRSARRQRDRGRRIEDDVTKPFVRGASKTGAGGNTGDDKPLPDGLRPTEIGNAARLIRHAGHQLRYVHAWGKWLVYIDGRWILDEKDALVTELAKGVSAALFTVVRQFRCGTWQEGRQAGVCVGDAIVHRQFHRRYDQTRPRHARRDRQSRTARQRSVAAQRRQRHRRSAHRRAAAAQPRRSVHHADPGDIRPQSCCATVG